MRSAINWDRMADQNDSATHRMMTEDPSHWQMAVMDGLVDELEYDEDDVTHGYATHGAEIVTLVVDEITTEDLETIIDTIPDIASANLYPVRVGGNNRIRIEIEG